MQGKTVIYCAHRLSSIINVDKIHVLNDSKVVE
jgi:ABC-type multidrug transport system fused ATPase/permease subunit